jgi:hypothetical protein|tara:strand:- start:1766 stop:2182 length:417 start_codon:yes stop_codon:yes gene_type:complete
MADGFGLALQKGIRTRLINYTDLTALISTRVYDEPPADVVFPYLRFVEVQPRIFDVDDKTGARVDLTMRAHSRSASGRVEATQVVEAVRTALHRQEASVTTTGFNLIELIFDDYFAERDADGRGYTAYISFNVMMETT